MNILVTGACGYKGTVLVPKLLDAGHSVRAFDIQWFGDHLEPHDALEVVKGDVNEPESLDLTGVQAVIHLASIANDPTGDLNPKLTWETSCLATMRLADRAARAGIERFIYASSGSVYGLKDEEDVTEDLELVPLTEYNKTKMVSERVLLSYSDRMIIQIVRPATVCGLSARMRLDVSVNLLTMAALTKGKITVFGGEQVRPNIHIQDMCSAYLFLLNSPEIAGVFNVGFENLSIMEIAKKVAAKVDVPIEVTRSDDTRSYRVNSDKIIAAGFEPEFSVDDAISEIIASYQRGELRDEARHHNLRWMEQNGLANA